MFEGYSGNVHIRYHEAFVTTKKAVDRKVSAVFDNLIAIAPFHNNLQTTIIRFKTINL